MARLRAIAIAAAVLMVVVPASIAGDLSGLFEGRWTGNGTIRPQSFNQPEKARCKVVGTALPSGATRFSGRCATVGGSGAFKMTIRQVPGTERYDVEAQMPDIVQPVRMRGSAQDRTLTLTLRRPLKRDGRTVTARIDIDFPDEGTMNMTQTVTDVSTNERVRAVSMVFEKR